MVPGILPGSYYYHQPQPGECWEVDWRRDGIPPMVQAQASFSPSGPLSETQVLLLQTKELGSGDLLPSLRFSFLSGKKVGRAKKLMGFCWDPRARMQAVGVRSQAQGLQWLRPAFPSWWKCELGCRQEHRTGPDSAPAPPPRRACP